MRQYEILPNQTRILKAVVCDRCKGPCIVEDGCVEAGHITAKFEHGFHQGDRFVVDLCQGCFDDLMIEVLVENGGTCIYENVYNPKMTYEHMQAMYEAMASGRFEGDELEGLEGMDEEE